MSFEWEETTLGDVLTLQRGMDLPLQDRRAGTHPIVASTGIVGYHDTAPVKGAGVVIGRSGSIGGGQYIVQDFWPLNTTLWVKDFKGNDPRYCYYLLKSIDFSSMNAGSGVPTLNRNHLHPLKVVKPSVSLQKSIAAILGNLDDRITLLCKTNASIEAIAQTLFKSWFVDFDPVRAKSEGKLPEGMDEATAALFPDAFEETELGAVPIGWQIHPFLDVCDLQGGSQPPASVFVDELRDGYVRLLQIRDFSSDAHTTYIPDTAKLKKVNEDDVLIGRYGSASGDKAKDSLGRVCRGLSGAYNVALMKLNPLLVGREFAFQLVSDPRFYNYLQGVSSKAVQSGFSKNELAQYKTVLPNIDLIKRYEQFGVDFWLAIKTNNCRIKTLKSLRDTLLPRLISGQIRIDDADVEQIEAAST